MYMYPLKNYTNKAHKYLFKFIAEAKKPEQKRKLSIQKKQVSPVKEVPEPAPKPVVLRPTPKPQPTTTRTVSPP